MGIPFVEVSAMTGENIDRPFEILLKLIAEKIEEKLKLIY